MSSKSIDSNIPFPSLDDTPSLDEVFEVLYEMELFGSVLPMNAPLTTPSTHPVDDLSHTHSFDDLYQLPVDHISHSNPCKSFQNLMNGLETPTRGLVSAMGRLCELLSNSRSDHLDFVFVRKKLAVSALLNFSALVSAVFGLFDKEWQLYQNCGFNCLRGLEERELSAAAG